jgi:hypothetical protein
MKRALENQQEKGFEKPEEFEKTGKDILDGDYEYKEEIDVCEYEKDKYCLANSSCPDSLEEEKEFYNAKTILYFVKKDDPRGDEPDDPESDPQYENWQDGIDEWVKDEEDDDEMREIPEDECGEDDFDDHFVEVSISSPNNGDTISSNKFKISTKTKGDADVDKIEFFIDGNSIGTRKSSPYDLSYEIPDSKNGGEIEIRVKAKDEDGGEDEDKIKVKVDF